jgi:SPASM domain peptide maturase of grasp-with-spasm system
LIANKTYKLFSDCIPVRGETQAALYDLTRNRYFQIPISFYDIVSQNLIIGNDLLTEYADEGDRETLVQYFEFLLSKELIFELNGVDEKLFPKIHFELITPGEINSSIIEFDSLSIEELSSAIYELSQLGCKNLLLRAYQDCALDYLNAALHHIHQSTMITVDIIIPFSNSYPKEKLEMYVDTNPKIKSIILHSSPFSVLINKRTDKSLGSYGFTKQVITSEYDTHSSPKEYFNVNIELFAEAQGYNPFLYKKMSIDSRGNVCNSPGSDIKFGKYVPGNLNSILKIQEFKSLWEISKDKIEPCKFCEYRYMCTYSREPKLIDNKWTYDIKCDYNPQTGHWSS